MKLSNKIAIISILMTILMVNMPFATSIGGGGTQNIIATAPLNWNGVTNTISLSTNSVYFGLDANNALTLTSSFVSSVANYYLFFKPFGTP